MSSSPPPPIKPEPLPPEPSNTEEIDVFGYPEAGGYAKDKHGYLTSKPTLRQGKRPLWRHMGASLFSPWRRSTSGLLQERTLTTPQANWPEMLTDGLAPVVPEIPHFGATASHKRVYLSISSEGYGHSSRALAMARHFNEGDLLIGSYGYALDRIEAFGYPVVRVPQEYELIGDSGSVNLSKTLVKNHDRPLKLNQIVQREAAIMEQYGVTLVVADGRVAPVLAASRLRLPCVVVTNQSEYYPFFKQDSPLVKLFGRSFEMLMQWWLSSADEILIPDFPPPYTVCLPNLSDDPQVKKRSRFVGPMVNFDPQTIPAFCRDALGASETQPLVVVSLGGHTYRRPVFDAMLTVAEKNPGWHVVILAEFDIPTGKTIPANVKRFAPPKDATPYFKAADLVVTQGGHSTAMELLALGKPSVVVPDANQMEQQNNANRLQALGVSICIHHGKELASRLNIALQRALNTPAMVANAQHMATLAQKHPGAENAAQLLHHYAQRLLAY